MTEAPPTNVFDAVMTSTSNRFSDLAETAGLDPAFDFMNIDFRGFDFADSDLRNYRFRGSELYGANLSRTKLSATTLAGALVGDAILPIGSTSSDSLRFHVGLSVDEIGTLLSMFPSMQRAARAAVIAASFTADDDFREFLWEKIDTENGFFRDNALFQSIGVSLDRHEAETVSNLSNIARQPMWIILNFLLVQAAISMRTDQPFKMDRFRRIPAFVDGLESEFMLAYPTQSG